MAFPWLKLPLKPCPFCDAASTHLWPVRRDNAIVIHCGRCGSYGPALLMEWRKWRPDDRRNDDDIEAVTAWNRRRTMVWSEWHEINPNGKDPENDTGD